MKRAKKGGRPRKADAEKLNYKLTVKLCTKDYFSLKAKAVTAGMSPSEFARAAIIDCRITPRLTPQEAGWIRDLSGMCNNLNQLARQANRDGFTKWASANASLGLDILNVIKLIRNDGKNH